jgi:S-disulfanyl-L-cysteine oxidoreductase SoxD
MSTRRLVLPVIVALAFGAGTAFAQSPGLGKPISEADVAAWDIAVMPDGTGLPPGSGTAVQGTKVFAEKCAVCHGDGGKGGPVARNPLFGGRPVSDGIDTPKTIGNFWGYATTIFDFTRRAMPFNQPRTFTADEIYATTAYILFLNKIIGENDVMNAETLPKVKMPNADNFIIRFPDRI